MKITKLSIKNFHQFKDLEVDLTYPKGHKKAGEPLEKVCFIGQSGTGKTTLLKLIGGHTYTIGKLFNEYDYKDFENVRLYKRFNNIDVEIRVTLTEEDGIPTYRWQNQLENNSKTTFESALEKQKDYLNKIKNQFIYFPAELKFDTNENKKGNIADKKVIDFSDYNLGDVWNIVLTEIQKYREKLLVFKQNIANVAQEENVDIEKIQKEIKKLENWQKKVKNPLVSLADDCLDPLLKHFNLRIQREFEFQKQSDFSFINVEDLEGNTIPQNLFSTGTKQVIFSAVPLYLLKPDDALILFDEPERSLYPNIQKILIDYYTKLAINSQFFFATHSPIIASSFEPWEIVELKFDNKGKVYQELYYNPKKERHVDNYTIIPSYLTYDLMLNKVFDLTQTHSTERSEKIAEVLMLRNRVKAHKEKGTLETEKGKKDYEKYKDLANKLFWDFEIN
ncbi:MAG: AAA family ATPase [Flavobacterium sp.]|nr:AAA family ATPase [Flavobacterium sp.]